MSLEIALTPALSHPLGEGESSSDELACREAEFAGLSFANPKAVNRCSLSHRMGEGKGEGLSA
jgi:hypothetical protein